MLSYRNAFIATLVILATSASAATLLGESFATYPPAGWTEATGILADPTTLSGTSSAWISDGFGNVGTTGCAKLNVYGTTRKEWMFTPQIDLGAGGNYSLEFDLALTHYANTNPDSLGVDDKFAVVISTDGGTTWYASNTLQLWNNTTPISNTGDHIVISLAAYSGTIKLGFYGESTVSNQDNDLFVDNVWVGDPTDVPNCTTPIAPTDGATGVQACGGTLRWNAAFNTSGYYLYFGTDGAGVTPPTDIVNGTDLGNVTSYTYSGLAYSTTYHWQVIPYNSYGSASGCDIWDFTTMADPTIASFPYTEGFENATFPPVGWQALDNNGDGDAWIRSTSNPHTGSACARIYTYGNTSNNDWLITPPLALAGNQRITFWTRSYSAGDPDELQVLLSTTDCDLASFTTTLMASTLINSATYLQYSLDLSAYTGSVFIAFVRNQAPADGYYLYLDDVVVEDIPAVPPGCTTLVSPTNGQVNVLGHNGVLQWVADVNATGYYLYFGTDGGGATAPTNIENGTDVGNVTTYNYVDIAYSTLHYWQVIPYNTYGSASGCAIWSFTTMSDPNWGSGGTPPNVYYFANSLATGAPSYPTYDWVDISATGTYVDLVSSNSSTDGADAILGDDDWVGPINFDPTLFPSGFTFYGTAYTQFCICSNGKIYFGDLTGSNENIYAGAMGTGATIRPAVYWMGQDMNPQDLDVVDRAVYYGGGGGGMVVTFWHFPEYVGTGADDHITAQVILYPNGNIKVQYNEDELGSTFNYTTDSHVVGIVNSDGLNFIEYRRLTGATVNTAGPLFGSNLAVMFGPDDSQVPVELSSFSGVGGAGFAQLRWETATEHENLGYYLLRKGAGAEAFVRVNQDLIQGAGTTLEPTVYGYRDEGLAAGAYLYKLVDVSFDGATAEHGPITVAVGDELPLTFSIQAKNGEAVEFRLALPVQTPMSLNVYDLAGREVWKLERAEMAPGTYTIAWPGQTTMGSRAASSTYVYRVRCGDAFVQTGKVVLLR